MRTLSKYILKHGTFVEVSDDELIHFKYIKREKLPNGKWRYYYDWSELKNNVSSAINKTVDTVKAGVNKTVNNVKSGFKKQVDNVGKGVESLFMKSVNSLASQLDSAVEAGKKALSNLENDPKNIYDVNGKTYDEKLAKIKDTKEWKDIVARKDPEYVKKQEDGSYTYDIDKYLVNKKHPILDAIDDIASGRKVTVNEITQDSTVAGIKDYANGFVKSGAMVTGIITKFLTEKFKFQQGSYEAEIRELTDSIEQGKDYIVDRLGEVEQVANTARESAEQVANTARESAGNANAATTAATKMLSQGREYINGHLNTAEQAANTARESVNKTNVTKAVNTAATKILSQAGVSETTAKEIANIVSKAAGNLNVQQISAKFGVSEEVIESVIELATRQRQ